MARTTNARKRKNARRKSPARVRNRTWRRKNARALKRSLRIAREAPASTTKG
jgi:hypothetical protein